LSEIVISEKTQKLAQIAILDEKVLYEATVTFEML